MPDPSSAVEKRTLAEVLGDAMKKDPSIVGARVRGKLVDVHTPIEIPTDPAEIKPVHTGDPDGLHIIRHSTAHVMADAVQRLYPGTKVTFGPATDSGFYYDFDSPKGAFNEEDLAKIEAKMREIVAAKKPFRREVVSRDDARKLFQSMNETYKAEHVDRLPEGEDISLYRHGSVEGAAPGQDAGQWMDLCEGPHVPNTSYIGAVKLTAVAGAYWRGDERNPMLQRIYGTSFASEKELADHMKLLEEAKERDHRKLGKELELFMFHEYAPAMPFLLPRGAHVYNALAGYVRNLYLAEGYEEVITPQIFDKRLFETSGHWDNYLENMYLAVTPDRIAELFQTGDGKAGLELEAAFKAGGVRPVIEMLHAAAQKPMNCPSHCLIFGQRRRSYRELPWRVADFCRLHRYERGGVVHGMARVRSFAQDDAHIFCAPEQLEDEIARFLRFFYGVYDALQFKKIAIRLATRPDKRIGTDAQWDAAEGALEKALKRENLPFELSPGEGAFYGPKYEFHVEDALKRSWQLGTLQIDYGLPDRFELEYVGSDGSAKRPVMLHRAIYGSLERFLSVYIEHTAGAFPAWIAPEQAVVVTVSEKQTAYAEEVVRELEKAGLRARADIGPDKLGAKIRSARLLRVPYVVVVGDKEAAGRMVAPRSRDENKDLGAMPLAAFVERLVAEAKPPRLKAPS